MSIKSFAEDDRPREKFLQKGRNSVSDSELLAIIMGSGSREESAIDLARRILSSVGNNSHQLSRLSLSDLMKFKGVGEAKAISIAAALEIGRRKASQEPLEKPQIHNSNDAYTLLHKYLGDLPTEEFWAIFLNQNNRVIDVQRLTQGGISQSVVDIRVLFKMALDQYATAIIVAHNHPSGNLTPSLQDLDITQEIKKSGDILGISLLDHIIIGNNTYISLKEQKYLKKKELFL